MLLLKVTILISHMKHFFERFKWFKENMKKKLTCGCQFIIKYFDPSLPKSNSYSILFILLVKYLKMVQANCPIIFYVIYISPHDLNISTIKYKMHFVSYLSNYVKSGTPITDLNKIFSFSFFLHRRNYLPHFGTQYVFRL